MLTRFIQWLRLMNGRCPYCNSDAPELYDCPVCEYYTGKWPPDEQTKDLWRVRLEILTYKR